MHRSVKAILTRLAAEPCVNGNPRQCEFPHARND